MHRFKDLEIWKQGRILCTEIYEITSSYPEQEKFGLTSQLRRASVSVPFNIAEGVSRKSNKGFSRFLEIVIGSCYEIETQLILSHDLDFIKKADKDRLLKIINSIIKMTVKFRSSLK